MAREALTIKGNSQRGRKPTQIVNENGGTSSKVVESASKGQESSLKTGESTRPEGIREMRKANVTVTHKKQVEK